MTMSLNYNTILSRANELYAAEKLRAAGKLSDVAYMPPEFIPSIESEQVKSILKALVEAITDAPLKTQLASPDDIPHEWKTRLARRTSTVRIRDCAGVEEFKVDWQDSVLVSDPELDLIVIQDNGKEYPCKKDIFYSTYEKVNDCGNTQKWAKKATSTLVEIPAGCHVEIKTLEGTLPAVSFPDYIVIGASDELYANTYEFAKTNLTFV